jgi:hypothetical protein
MATFADSKNPADDFVVLEAADGGYIIGVRTYCECGSACCSRPETGTRPHTKGQVFEDPDEANDWIDNCRESFEDQYDAYLEENHDAIVQQERYEAFLAEQ